MYLFCWKWSKQKEQDLDDVEVAYAAGEVEGPPGGGVIVGADVEVTAVVEEGFHAAQLLAIDGCHEGRLPLIRFEIHICST